MKKLITLICFCLSMKSAFAQAVDIDSFYHKVASEKDESKRLKELNLFFSGSKTKDPMIDMQYAQRILMLSQQSNYKISEAFVLSQIEWDYISFGNTVKNKNWLKPN